MPVDCVTMNFGKGIAEAVTHLVEMGHRRLAFIAAVGR